LAFGAARVVLWDNEATSANPVTSVHCRPVAPGVCDKDVLGDFQTHFSEMRRRMKKATNSKYLALQKQENKKVFAENENKKT
jgi:hypothetical protein